MSIVDDIINALNSENDVSTLEFARLHALDHQAVIGAMNSLEASERVVSEIRSSMKIVVTAEGADIAKTGSHEYHIYSSIPPDGIKQENLVKNEKGLLGFNKAMSLRWINIVGGLVHKKMQVDKDAVRDDLIAIEANMFKGDAALVKEYKKRQLIKEIESKYFLVRRGPKFQMEDCDENLVSVLTKELIKELGDGIRNVKFKSFNLSASAKRFTNANLHPLLKVKKEYVDIFVKMGFQEMPTNNYVESSFWNFDALFQPQDHPARDAHDTFFINDPATSDKVPLEYLHRVQQVHSNGGYGSQGYKHPWRIEESQKNLMRTHTTAVSARMLYQLAQKEQFEPVRYFSIDRVFRNETLDATHLAEFHQVEGLVADRGLSLGNMMAYIRQFFRELGLHKIRFKPTYNPYTEPSMEIYGFHEGLKKWIELGNSGIFRPEMLLPMGLPEDVVVIAWGLSLERPTMIMYGYNDIRDLMGPKIDLTMVYNSGICQLSK